MRNMYIKCKRNCAEHISTQYHGLEKMKSYRDCSPYLHCTGILDESNNFFYLPVIPICPFKQTKVHSNRLLFLYMNNFMIGFAVKHVFMVTVKHPLTSRDKLSGTDKALFGYTNDNRLDW